MMLLDALRVAGRDLRIQARYRETWLWMLLMPLLFMLFFGAAVARVHDDSWVGGALAVRVGADAGFLADELVRRLGERGFAVSRLDGAPDDAPAWREARSRLDIPPGFTASVAAGEPVELSFRADPRHLAAALHRLRARQAVTLVLADWLAARSARAGTPETPRAADFERLRAWPRALALEVRPAGRRAAIPSGFQQAVPGLMVMFVLLGMLTVGAASLLAEREGGQLARLASAPISRRALVLGKALARLVQVLIQVVFLMSLGALLFGMSWQGRALPVLAVMGALAALVACTAILLGSLARTQTQAVGLGVVASTLLAALGGCWWPVELAPAWMQTLALIVPTGIAMDAVHRLVAFGDPVAAVLPHLLALALGAGVVAVLAARAFRFR